MSDTAVLRHWLRLGLGSAAAGVAAAVTAEPGPPRRPEAPAAGAPGALDRDKVLGEAALIARMAGRLLRDGPADPVLGREHATLVEALEAALDPTRAAVLAAADPRLESARQLYPFALLGDLDTAHRATARTLVRLDAGPGPLRRGDATSPFDDLERAWLTGLVDSADAAPAVPAGSVLRRGADLLTGTLEDAYGLTHAVLFATDAGLSPTRATARSLGRAPADVARDAEALLGQALASANLDVTAELLWTWPMLGLPLSASAEGALAEIARAVDTHGRVPGPSSDEAVRAGLTGADRDRYDVHTGYHTAIVVGVLAATLLRRPAAGVSGDRPGGARRPDRTTATPPPLTHATGAWVGRLPDAPLHDATAPLVLGAELRLAAGRGDLAGLRDVLAWAAGAGWGDLPHVTQAAEHLTRVARALTTSGPPRRLSA